MKLNVHTVNVMIIVRNAGSVTRHVAEYIVGFGLDEHSSLQDIHSFARTLVTQCEAKWLTKCTYDYTILD